MWPHPLKRKNAHGDRGIVSDRIDHHVPFIYDCVLGSCLLERSRGTTCHTSDVRFRPWKGETWSKVILRGRYGARTGRNKLPSPKRSETRAHLWEGSWRRNSMQFLGKWWLIRVTERVFNNDEDCAHFVVTKKQDNIYHVLSQFHKSKRFVHRIFTRNFRCACIEA